MSRIGIFGLLLLLFGFADADWLTGWRPSDAVSPSGRDEEVLHCPDFNETAFNVVGQAREIWRALNGSLVDEDVHLIVSGLLDITYREFKREDAWSDIRHIIDM